VAGHGAAEVHAIQLGLELADVAAREHPGRGLRDRGEPAEQSVVEQGPHGGARHRQVARAEEEVALEELDQLVALRQQAVGREVDDVQAHAAVDVAADGGGDDDALGLDDRADRHAGVARMEVRRGAGAVDLAARRVTDGGQPGELAQGLGLDREALGEQDLGRSGVVRGVLEADPIDTTLEADIEALAREGREETVQLFVRLHDTVLAPLMAQRAIGAGVPPQGDVVGAQGRRWGRSG
jgi:hypothetical protein